jgi:hypothetical protein
MITVIDKRRRRTIAPPTTDRSSSIDRLSGPHEGFRL